MCGNQVQAETSAIIWQLTLKTQGGIPAMKLFSYISVTNSADEADLEGIERLAKG